MHKKPKLSVEDFYHQFHNTHHYRDSGDTHREVSHRRPTKGRARHQGFDFKSLHQMKKGPIR